jgi:threonine dehydrogenase-like Zn-dependent dehydrogenase
MRGLWLERQALRLREDLPAPAPAPGEARVRVIRAGICNTDLELVRGYYPFAGVPGHEFVGRVEGAPGAEEWQGRRVVGEINASCGRCPACAAGRRSHCERRTVLGIVNRNGAFAESLTLPVENLHEVPENLPDEIAVFTEPLAAALEIQEQVKIGPGDRVVVVGDGKLGNLVAQTLALTGCALLVIGRHRRKLALLADRGIATDVPDAIRPGGADVVVECTGNPEGFALARSAVRPRGTLVLKSTYAGTLALDMSRLVVDEITLVGSRCGPFAPALALLAERRVDVAPLVEARFPLDEALAAFEEAARPGVLKVLVEMEAAAKA